MLHKLFQLSDNNIIDGILKGGNQRRINENKLYEKYYYFIKEGVKRYHLDEDESASVYSDTILAVIDSINQGSFEKRSELKTYFFQIFSNKCVSYIRKKTTKKASSSYDTVELSEVLYPLSDESKSVIQKIIEEEEENILLNKLRSIGEKCKELLTLWAEGLTDKEIFTRLAYQSSDVVKVSRMRCLTKLREKYR